MKDKWVLNRLEYEAIAPQSESTIIPAKIMDYLFAIYPRIVLFYDNDEAGKEFTNKMISLYPELSGIFIPNEYKEKDISDFIEVHKIDEAKGLMKKLI
jgi:5S rRNA maturation endonuclease (ribonuclease M5)